MITSRFVPAAVAALSLFLGATPVHAYVTPDEFIKGNGGSSAPADNADDRGNVPLPNLGAPQKDPIQDVPLPKLIPLPDVMRPNPRARALVVPPVVETQPATPTWESAEEERKALRGVHTSAPEIPHTAATPLPSSGLPLAIPLLMSALIAGSIRLIRKKNFARD